MSLNVLTLIGGMKINSPPDDYTLISSLFERLPKKAGLAGATRLLGFEAQRPDGGRVQFLGMACRPDDRPQGFVSVVLGDSEWTVRSADGAIEWVGPVSWNWRTLNKDGECLGEFTAACPEAWSGDGGKDPLRFTLFARVPYHPALAFQDDVTLVDYNPAWPARYAELEHWLKEKLGPGLARRIEHYGSTAIPGLPAKPILDVLVEIPSFDTGRETLFSGLSGKTWEYWRYSDHMIFIKRKELMGERTAHVHVAPRGHRLWKGLVFRDYLRAHAEEARQYAELKRGLADRFKHDRERYTQEKTSFIMEVLKRASGSS